MRYLVVVEEGPTSFGAHVPDLPGCVAVAQTRDEALTLIREAIEFHIEGLKRGGSQFLHRRQPARLSMCCLTGR